MSTQSNISVTTLSNGTNVATNAVNWAGQASNMQVTNLADPTTGVGASVGAAGTPGANGVTVNVGNPVTTQPLPASYLNVTDNTAHTINGAVAILGLENLSAAPQAVSITVYDNTAASGTVLGGPYTLSANQLLVYPPGGKKIVTGLTVKCSAAPADAGIQVLYR